MFCDFSFDMGMDSLSPASRLKDPNLGGGAPLDLGVYPLTFSNIILDDQLGDKALHPEITSSMAIPVRRLYCRTKKTTVVYCTVWSFLA
jgi:dihydrodiol dehydrogenase / D-xylose 1-dehydrogenase (NADP)